MTKVEMLYSVLDSEHFFGWIHYNYDGRDNGFYGREFLPEIDFYECFIVNEMIYMEQQLNKKINISYSDE